MDDKRIVELYDRAGNEPAAWRLTARALIAAADVLANAYPVDFMAKASKSQERLRLKWQEVHAPSLMLRAFAMECFLKAVWLKKGAALTRSGKLQGVPVKHHDLIALTQAVDALRSTDRVNLSVAEEDMLGRLSLYVELGRYPVATHWTTGWEHHPKAGKTWRGGWYIPTDNNLLAALFKRVERIAS